MKSIDRIIVRSDVANWPLPSLRPTAMGIGSAVMAVPVPMVTDRSDLCKLLLVPALLAVVYQMQVVTPPAMVQSVSISVTAMAGRGEERVG